MAVVLEREIGTTKLPPGEKKYLTHEAYQRNGTIPGWDEVVVRFELTKLDPRDFRLTRGYYRAQRRIAEGRNKKAQRIFRGLEKTSDFVVLEKERANLLNGIAVFVRGKGR